MPRGTTFGALPFRVEALADASVADMFALALDPPRMADVEPSIRSAEWTGELLRVPGARVAVIAQVPFSSPIIERFVPHANGVATLLSASPPHEIMWSLTSTYATGYMSASFSTRHDGGSTIVVAGEVLPRMRVARLAFAASRSLLVGLINRAISRGITRAVADVLARPQPVLQARAGTGSRCRDSSDRAGAVPPAALNHRSHRGSSGMGTAGFEPATSRV